MVKNIKDFLKNPKTSKINKILKLNREELEILTFLLDNYLEGIEDLKVSEVLSIFNKSKLETIDYIKYVKNLLNEGWIVINSFGQIKSFDITTLELFNSNISLSISFLKLLEEGKIDVVVPEKKPYKEHLEYLQDEFLRVEIYEQLTHLKNNYSKESASIKRLQSKLKLIENTIKERIKLTEIELPVLNFMIENNLNEKEQIIFLALLKEEYTGSNEAVREGNYLLDLVSFDEVDRIKNRSLLDENSKLMSEGILECDELFGAFGGFSRMFFISENVLNSLLHPRKKQKITHLVKDTIFDLVESEVNLDEVVLPTETKKMINGLLKQVDKRVMNLLKKWGIKESDEINAKIIFYGDPGTGKTITAKAIAGELNKPLLSLDSSKILSMYVGESEKNVRRLFDEYYEIAEKLKTQPILLLNEADQFLSTRTTSSLSSADKMHNQMQNIFLEQIENFDGILIATTNLLETIDKAFSRRFDYKIKFDKPEFKDRVKLWKLKLPKNADLEVDIKQLAKYELTGAQIEVIIKNTAIKVAMKRKPIFTTKDFIDEIEKEKRNAFDSDKEVGFIK